MSMGNFDYGDLATVVTTPYTVKANAQFISGTVLLILGIVGSLLVYLMLICKRGRGFAGTRYYAFFLVTCNLLYLADIIGNYSSFPFMNMMPPEVGRTFSALYPAALEWFNITYCWLTTFLFFETIIRSRLNSAGFPHVVWFFLCCLFTILPGVYMALKYTAWKYYVWDPEPYTILHLVGYLLLLLTSIGMILSAIILLCSREKLKDASGPFSVSAFLGVFIYGMITVWWQFPSGYEISRSLMQSRVDPAVMIDVLSKISGLVQVFTTTKDYATLSLSAILTWGMLVLLPGISMFGVGNKKNISSNRIGDSGEKPLTAA
ncbi:hypothetical protein FO519_005837 [Halicephalobus sp. NKZ332]|nr:hypothetical protein FO519_005837 [Halicephalobus sp. NKZ332]